jgi:hypothetical protein
MARSSRIAVCGGLIVAAVTINQSAVHWRVNDADSHLFAYYGWCVTQGATLYQDVWDNKPPGIFWTNAGAIALVGPGVVADVLVGAIAQLALLIAVAGAARELYGWRLVVPTLCVVAVLTMDVRFECGANRTEPYVAAWGALTIWGYLRWWRRGRWRWLVVSGLAAGVGVLFKQAALAAPLACGVHLLWNQARGTRTRRRLGLRPWAIGIVAALLPVAATGCVLAARGALAEAAFAAGGFNRAYFAIGDATWWRMDRALLHYADELDMVRALLVVVALGVVVHAAAWLLRSRGLLGVTPGRSGVGVVVVWLVVTLYLALAGPGRMAYHLAPALPAVALLLMLPVHLTIGRRDLIGGLIARPRTAVVVLIIAYFVAGFAVDGARELRRCWHTKPAWLALRRSAPTDGERCAAAIRARTGPHDRIYIWGWSPEVYRHARRLPAAQHPTLEKIGQVGVHAAFMAERVLGDLEAAPPRLLAFSTRDRGRMARGELGPALRQLVTAQYDEVAAVMGMHLFVRRPESVRRAGEIEASGIAP